MGARIDLGGKDGVGPLFDALNNKIDKLEANLGQVAKQSKVTAREAEAVWRKAQSPADRYNETLRKARGLLDKTAEGQRKHAQVVAMANAKLREQQSFFGSSAVGKLTRYAAGLMGIQQAVSRITAAFGAARAARDEFAAVQAEGMGATNRLAQVAGDVPGGLPALDRMSKRMSLREGITEDAASSMLFSLQSASSLGERDFAGKMVGRGAFKPGGGVIKSAAALKKHFAHRNLSFERSMDIIVSAAKENPALAEELGSTLGPLAQTAGLAGLEPEETASTLAVLASGTTDIRTAGTQLQQIIQRRIVDPKFEGMSLQQMAESMQGRSAREIQGFFPEQRGFRGMAQLAKEPGAIGELNKEVMGSAGLTREVAARPANLRVSEAQYRLNQSRERKRIASERLGVASAEARTAIQDVEAEAATLGFGSVNTSIRQFGARIAGGFARYFTDDPDTVEWWARQGATAGREEAGEAGLSKLLSDIEHNTRSSDMTTVEQ